MTPQQARVRVHDHYQLELKLDYALDGGRTAKTAQGFDAWLFFPSNLGIDEPSFSREGWYADLTTYIRFQTPRMGLDRLFAEADALSPFAWLARNVGVLTSGSAPAADVSRALRELRLFAAIFRSHVRDESQYLLDRLRRGEPPRALAEVAERVGTFLDGTLDGLGRYRHLRRRLLDARTPSGLAHALDAVDDFLSLQVLERWFSLLDTFGGLGLDSPVSARLRAALEEETRHREGLGRIPGAAATDRDANERLVQRHNLLKKYVLAVLHLQLVSSRRRERIQDVLLAIAAAVAMAVAVALQLVALWTVGTPTGPQSGALAAFMALAVGGYMLKDRMKERLKHWFVSSLPRWLFDRRQNLRVEADGDHIGAVEETVRLVRPAEVPGEVRRLREHGEEALFAGHRNQEDVVHYRRALFVAGPKARRHAPEMQGLNEILRLNVQRWLRRMDDPVRALWRLGEDGVPVRTEAPKTYRVTLVLGMRRPGEQVQYEKRVIVLSREGILRVEDAGVY